MIDRTIFKQWLIAQGIKEHIAKDYASRARKAEDGLMKAGQSKSFDEEFKKDEGQRVLDLFAGLGANIKEKAGLPVGKPTIHNYATAMRKYFRFLEENSKN